MKNVINIYNLFWLYLFYFLSRHHLSGKLSLQKIVNSRNNIFVSLDIMKLNIIWFRYKGIS